MGQDGVIFAQWGYGPEAIVVLLKGGQEEVKSFKDANRGAISSEFVAFAKAVLEGKEDPNGTPMEALEDLIILESLLQSGERNGQTIAVR